ncbi:hypothetical protein [Dysgonomonas reticulitermitis]
MKKTFPLRSETAYPVIARYFKSGLRPHEFYKKEGWSDNQFSYRKKRYMAECDIQPQTDAASPQFHPVTVTNMTRSITECSANPLYIELEYTNGALLRIDGKFDDLRIASLIKLY